MGPSLRGVNATAVEAAKEKFGGSTAVGCHVIFCLCLRFTTPLLLYILKTAPLIHPICYHMKHTVKVLGIVYDNYGEKELTIEPQWKKCITQPFLKKFVLGINEEQISYSPWVSTRNNSNKWSLFSPLSNMFVCR